MRIPWRRRLPPVFVHCAYAEALKSHPDYRAAKLRGDAEAAHRLIENLAAEATLDKIADSILREETHVVSPAKDEHFSNNALAPTYAVWLAAQLDLHFHGDIYLADRRKRDLSNGWERLVNPSTFYGRVPENSDFIVADDVCTVGGTIADMISFLELNGGRVVCATALAASGGSDVPLLISDATRIGLEREYGGALDAFLREGLGHGIECLTEREARLFLGKGPSLDRVREALARAADASDDREGQAGRGREA